MHKESDATKVDWDAEAEAFQDYIESRPLSKGLLIVLLSRAIEEIIVDAATHRSEAVKFMAEVATNMQEHVACWGANTRH